jgi:pyruvate carboxylase
MGAKLAARGHAGQHACRRTWRTAGRVERNRTSPCDGVVDEPFVALGDTVEAKDLLVRIRPAT